MKAFIDRDFLLTTDTAKHTSAYLRKLCHGNSSASDIDLHITEDDGDGGRNNDLCQLVFF